MTVEQADRLIAVARKHDRVLVANLMQRYNPLFDAVNRLIQSQTLGDLLHGYFENYASDENLPPEHWFWDRTQSGGIFIEHGVHFFDLFAGWLGAGTVVAAERSIRPGSSPPIEEQVQCTVRYGPTALVNFYHGFHQTGRMDRQEMRLVFERGDVTLYDWVPTQRPRSRDCRRGRNTRTLRDLPGRAARCLGGLCWQGPRLPGPPQIARHLPDGRAFLGRRDQQVPSIRRAAPGHHDRPGRLDP